VAGEADMAQLSSFKQGRRSSKRRRCFISRLPLLKMYCST